MKKEAWLLFERIMRVVMTKVLGIFGMELKDETWEKFMQFVKFCIVGVSNFLISYVIYSILVLRGYSKEFSNLMGFLISVLNSYYWNSRYVFKETEPKQRSWIKSLLKTYMSYLFSGLVLTELLLILWVDILGIPQLLAPILSLFITTPVNFIANKLWAFRKE